MKMTGAEIVIATLLEQGTDTVFGYPGATVIDIYDKLEANKDKITHVLAAHEQGAAHAADGYARATGRPGVVIATGDFYDQSRYDAVRGNKVLALSVLGRVRMRGRWRNLLRLRLESVKRRLCRRRPRG